MRFTVVMCPLQHNKEKTKQKGFSLRGFLEMFIITDNALIFPCVIRSSFEELDVSFTTVAFPVCFIFLYALM